MTAYVIQIGNQILGNSSGIFVVGQPVAAVPTFSVAPGTYNNNQTVAITSATMPSSIYYTTDGSPPTYPITGTTQLYGGPLTLSTATTVRAIAAATFYTNSPPGMATYAFQVGVPNINPGTGMYATAQPTTISCATTGAAIYYTTNNTTPSATNGTRYTGPFTVNVTEVVQAIGILAGYTDSLVSSANYTITQMQVATPRSMPAPGPFAGTTAVTLLCDTPGASIYYAINATPTYPPTGGTTLYSTPIEVATSETIEALAVLGGYINSNIFSGFFSIGGAAQVFNFPSFSAANIGTGAGQINLVIEAALAGNAIEVEHGPVLHTAGAAWYADVVNIASFTTNFTFLLEPNSALSGLTFCVQNSNATVEHDGGFWPRYGNNATADANAMGYGKYGTWTNAPGAGIYNSVAVAFTTNNQISGGQGNPPGNWSITAFYTQGAPDNPQLPQQDTLPFGLNLNSGNVMAATIVYDGTILTMVVKDTVAHTQARFTWPINIPINMAGMGIPPVNTGTSDTAWVGFTASNPKFNTFGPGTATIYSWNYSTGYNTRLATPTFSIPSGEYSSGQTFTITVPAGSTVYYTTNGLLPTSASTAYTAGTPIALTANTCIQAVAIGNGYTDSYVGSANYSVGTANVINYPAGFAANDGVVLCGNAALAGTKILVTPATPSTNTAGVNGAAWYGLPVPITGNWTTTFTLQWTAAGGNGLGFIIQNQDSTVGQNYVRDSTLGGGPNLLMLSNQFSNAAAPSPADQIPSYNLNTGVMVYFDLYHEPNSVGLYTPVPTTPDHSTQTEYATGLTFNGNTYTVTLNYNATAHTLQIIMGSFNHTWSVNIPSIVDASAYNNAAYVGFAAYCGGATANQYVNSWTFTP